MSPPLFHLEITQGPQAFECLGGRLAAGTLLLHLTLSSHAPGIQKPAATGRLLRQEPLLGWIGCKIERLKSRCGLSSTIPSDPVFNALDISRNQSPQVYAGLP